jgi:hypothetical protein
MSDEPTKFIVIGLDALGIGVAEDGTVVVRLGGLEKEAGLTPGLGVMLGFSPDQAREFAQRLNSKAREAEGGSSEH